MTFDFIGTSTDESSDDLCTVQIPTSWRPAFLEFSTLQLFFDLYSALPASLSPLSLSCLVQIASVRRSLFNNAERGKFLNQLVTGVREILQNPSGKLLKIISLGIKSCLMINIQSEGRRNIIKIPSKYYQYTVKTRLIYGRHTVDILRSTYGRKTNDVRSKHGRNTVEIRSK